MARSAVVLVLWFAFQPACAPMAGDHAPAGGDGGATVSADVVDAMRGIADHDRDPAVVAIDVEGVELCTGAVVSPHVVLTARHCVSRTARAVACPPTGPQVEGDRDPMALGIFLGDEVTAAAQPVAHGVSLVTSSQPLVCGNDVALLVLDTAIAHVKPLPIAATAAAKGDHLRAVGYAGRRRLLREHVEVLDVSAAELVLGDACGGDSGGPAIDEATGAVSAIASRAGSSCVYTRADVFSTLVDAAIAAAGDAAPSAVKHEPPSDIGGPCAAAAECAAGVCVIEGGQQYCSRLCGGPDRCPPGYRCVSVSAAREACVHAVR
jgi:hypothetical protein